MSTAQEFIGKLSDDAVMSCSRLPALLGVSGFSTPNDELRKSIAALDARAKGLPDPERSAAGEAADWGNRQVDRVARLADGWMTVGATPEQFGNAWREICDAAERHGRDSAQLENAIYFNLNLNDDRAVAYAESKRFLDEYYSSDWPEWKVNVWTACGAPAECAKRIRAFEPTGAQTMIIRFTSYDQKAQLARFLDEVAPLL